jgi:predicted nucleic acid-binding protein
MDTGPLVARHLPRDQHRDRARTLWKKLERGRQQLATSVFVVNEVATLLARWADPGFAAERVALLYESTILSIQRTEARDEQAALELLRKYGDQGVGFTDCTSFVLMRKAKIQRAFTFDRHFRAAGFSLWE